MDKSRTIYSVPIKRTHALPHRSMTLTSVDICRTYGQTLSGLLFIWTQTIFVVLYQSRDTCSIYGMFWLSCSALVSKNITALCRGRLALRRSAVFQRVKHLTVGNETLSSIEPGLSAVGNWAFQVAGPRVWTSCQMRWQRTSAQWLYIFYRRPKTSQKSRLHHLTSRLTTVDPVHTLLIRKLQNLRLTDWMILASGRSLVHPELVFYTPTVGYKFFYISCLRRCRPNCLEPTDC